MQAAIRGIEYYLPERVLSNEELAAEFPEWTAEKIHEKTGIVERHIVDGQECASDLAVEAAGKLFASGVCRPQDIDYLMLCTQTPDYFLPTTACLLQERLGIPETAGAVDIGMGCSGYVYSLSLAQGLIASGQASRLLLITSDTYTRLIHPQDKSVRTLFGDGAAATLIEAAPDDVPRKAAFVFGTDGRGAPNLIVPAGGFRRPQSPETAEVRPDADGIFRSANQLFMDGPEIFSFSLKAVPESVNRLLARTGKRIEDIDLYVFHQANHYLLEHLRKKLQIPGERFWTWMARCGNTTSSSIPIALKHALGEGRLAQGQHLLLAGFGVGYSWGAAMLEWPYLGCSPKLSTS